MGKYKVSFVLDDTGAEFKVEAFVVITLPNALDEGQKISDIVIERIDCKGPSVKAYVDELFPEFTQNPR